MLNSIIPIDDSRQVVHLVLDAKFQKICDYTETPGSPRSELEHTCTKLAP